MTESLGLQISLSPRLFGSPAKPFAHEFSKELAPSDIDLLNSIPRDNINSPLQRVTDRHHALARLLASGNYTNTQAAALLSMDPSRVSILKGSPAFAELLTFYRSQTDREARSNFERLTGLAADAADILQDRLENEPEKFSAMQLLEITKVAADRTGLGPSSTQTNVNVNVNFADKMKAARARAAKAASTPMLDITPNAAE
jgi:hypothetical protein